MVGGAGRDGVGGERVEGVVEVGEGKDEEGLSGGVDVVWVGWLGPLGYVWGEEAYGGSSPVLGGRGCRWVLNFARQLSWWRP